MQDHVYVDVLVLENIIMNYLILCVTAKFSRMKTTQLRLVLAALVGATYAVMVIVFEITSYYSAICKILLSFAMILIAYTHSNVQAFIKKTVIFYIVSFIFAGAFIGISFLVDSDGFITSGSYIGWNPKSKNLILSCCVLIVMLKMMYHLFYNIIIKDKLLVAVKIYFEDKQTEVSALIDTGNSLREPFTNNPVIVVEYEVVEKLLPDEIRGIFHNAKDNDLEYVSNIIGGSLWVSRFRLIPFTSLGKQNGILIGFKPDFIEIDNEKNKIKSGDVIIGVYSKKLSKDSQYRALLNPELVAL